MGLIHAVIVLLIAPYFSLGYILAPELSWPEDYHFEAEEINLITGIVKPFEIWFSTEHNRSRIDFFGGTIQRFYYANPVENDTDDYYSEPSSSTKIYLLHPQFENGENVKKCDVDHDFEDQNDFLPSLEDFTLLRHETVNGKDGQVWGKEMKMEEYRKTEEVVVIEEEGVTIPVRHTIKSFNMDNGGMGKHTVINYYNFDSKVPLGDLTLEDADECGDWSTKPAPPDLDEAIQHLHPSISSDVDMAFRMFKKHHKRSYNDNEHKSRREIFRENWEFIREQNERNLGFTLGVNELADKTQKELQYLRGIRGTDPEPIRGTHDFPLSEEDLRAMEETLPKDFDLRMEGVITPITNQAQCGSCWAFAATATMEGVLARSNGGRLMDLSEQSLVDCAWDYESYGCHGTMSIKAVFQYLMTYGIPTSEEYGPYMEEDGVCKINNVSDIYNIRGYVAVSPPSPGAVKAAIYMYGPLTTGVLVSHGMSFYKGGIFYDVTCRPNRMNHAVTLVGYGHRDGELYWIIKNSWGESWGNDGYLYISAKNNNCNVMDSPVYPLL